MTLIASDCAPGLCTGPDVTIPADAEIAPHVTIYPGVVIGSGARLGQGCILGRPQEIDGRSRSPRQPPGAVTLIGACCRIGSAAVVVAGATLGDRVYIGDHALIRETAVLGDDVMVGRSCIVTHSTCLRNRVRLQADVIVGPWTTIEEDVSVGPRVTFIGDPTMGRRPPGVPQRGSTVRRGARIGTAAVVLPPVTIGYEAVVGAKSLVREDVPARTVVVGTPAVALRAVRDDELLEAWEPDGLRPVG